MFPRTVTTNSIEKHTYNKIIERRYITMSQNYGGNGGYGSGAGFALIVVLFILLIIVGAAFMYNSY